MSVHCGSKSLSPGLDSGHPLQSPSPSFGCTSQAKIPSNLHVCHESRREALRQYRASFGIARQPGQTLFDPEQDYLYFGPRDGFMASEANLRTVMSLCDPTELAQVRRVAINEALFWVYDSAWNRQAPCYHNHHHYHRLQQQNQQLQTPPTTPMESHHHQHRRESQELSNALPPHGHLPPPSSPPTPPPAAAATMTQTSIAASLLVDILRLVRVRLPGLRVLVLVPRDENPLYSSDCYLTEPAMGQNRLRRQVSEALANAFGGEGEGDASDWSDLPPWEWKIRTLSADPDPPSYDRLVLGWCEAGTDTAGGGKDGRGGGVVGTKGPVAVTTRLGAVQESARRFLEVEMEVDVCGQ